MKKGIARIVLGAVLIAFQVMSFIGNAGVGFNLSFDSLASFVFDLISLVSYWFFGIVGVIILVSGIIARSKGETQSQPNEDCTSEEFAEDDTEEQGGFVIPLSKSLPILFAIFVVLLVLIIILS